MRPHLAAAVLALTGAAACGARAGKVATGPTLPAVRAVPAPPPAPAAEPFEADPWAGRTDLIHPPPPARPAPVRLPKVVRFTLANGLKVLVVAAHDLPVVSMDLAIGAGEEDETRGQRAIAEYTAIMLTRGTRRRSGGEIAQAMSFVGGTLGARVDLETTTLTCSVLSRDLATCLTLLPEIVTMPTFPEDEMQRVADRVAGEIARMRGDPAGLARQHLDNLLWGEDHVRGWPRTIEKVRAITRADLVAWHRARFTPRNALLVVAGDVDPRQLRIDLGRVFAPWKGRRAAPTPRYREPRLSGLRVRLVDRPDLTRSQIVVGGLGVAHRDRDYLAARLVGQVLGGSPSARLQSALRAKGVAAGAVSAGFEAWRTRGELTAASSAPTAQTVETLQLMLREMGRMKTDGPTAAELAAAKADLAGRYPARFETAAGVAETLLIDELHGLGDDDLRELPLRLDAVTLAEAKAAAAAHLDPGDLAVVIVGKGDEVAPALDRAGIRYQRVGYRDPVSKHESAPSAGRRPPVVDRARAAAGRKLLAAALAAEGGAARLRGIKDIKAIGHVKVLGGKQQLEGDWARLTVPPDRQRLDVTLPMGKVSRVITGKGVWQQVGKTVQDLSPELARQAHAGLWRDHDFIVLRGLEAGAIVESSGKVTFSGTAYDSVIVRQADGANETRILLDPKTHLIFRLLYRESGGPAVEEYSDYRPVQGLMLPFRQRAVGGGQEFDVTVSKYQINQGAAPDAFRHP